MKVDNFINQLLGAVADKTIYVKGGFGCRLTEKRKSQCKEAYAYNRRPDRAAKIDACNDKTFGFDCCGLIKGIIWGYTGDTSKVYGGAVYKSNGLDDLTESGLLKICREVSVNMNNIIPGEFLYMSGHCGVYIGNSRVVESTPSWKDGVQITVLTARKWTKHGKLPCVEYDNNTNEVKPVIASPTLRLGDKGMQVYYLQKDLNYIGYKLAEDGIFGPKTCGAVKDFQGKHSLVKDGIYGKLTYSKMREVI